MTTRRAVWSFAVTAVVVVALVLAALWRRDEAPATSGPDERRAVPAAAGLPRMVELGSDSCAACKAMQPVLTQLRGACAGRLDVEFVDIWASPERADAFRPTTIPTQVFLDPAGREIWRHEGFLAAPDVVAKWRELGFDVGDVTATRDAAPDVRTRLARTLEGARGLALGAAFLWGVLSIALSPCHLASIPLVVAFLGGYGGGGVRRTVLVATRFAVGILVALAAAGGIAIAAGTLAGDLGPWPSWGLAAILAAFGLHLAGVLPFDWAAPRLERFARGGALAPLVLGFVFGLALGPCAFAFIAPLLAVAFSVAKTQAVFAAGLLLLFAAGHCAAIVAGAASLDRVQRAVAWGGSRSGTIARAALGVLLVAAAVYVAHTTA